MLRQPASTLVSSVPKYLAKKIGVIGACFEKGQLKDGPQWGPAALRESGLIDRLDQLNYNVKDYGDVKLNHDSLTGSSFEDITLSPAELKLLKAKNAPIVAKYNFSLSEKVKECLKEDRICLTLGGDHSLAIGSLLGHSRVNPNLSLLWIDAHADCNTEKTTNSGNMHGMMLSFFLRGIDPEYANTPDLLKYFNGVEPILDPSSLCYIGLRDIDPMERHLLDSLQIKYFTMGDIDRLGITEATSRALEILKPSKSKPLHVSFDVDALDPSFAPCTGTPVSGGLTLREAMTIGEMVSSTDHLKCLDWVEVNPKVGQPKELVKTLDTSINVMLAFLDSAKKPCESNFKEKLSEKSGDCQNTIQID